MKIIYVLTLFLIVLIVLLIYNKAKLNKKIYDGLIVFNQIAIFSSLFFSLEELGKLVLVISASSCITIIALYKYKHSKKLKLEQQKTKQEREKMEQETLLIQPNENIDEIILNVKRLDSNNILIALPYNVPALQIAKNFWILHQLAQKENIKLTFTGVDKEVLSTAKVLGYKIDTSFDFKVKDY